LSARETEVLRWMSEGRSNREIGAVLGISRGTVRKHAENIYRKLGVGNRTAAA
jgi:DNA-binding CsgD family transcriptional regulator